MTNQNSPLLGNFRYLDRFTESARSSHTIPLASLLRARAQLRREGFLSQSLAARLHFPARRRCPRECRPLVLSGIEERHPQNHGIASHCVSRRNFDCSATSDHHYAAVHRQHAQVLAQVLVGQHLKNYINSTSVGQLLELIGEIGLAVVEDMVRPVFLYQQSSLLAAASADHREAARTRQLDCRKATPPVAPCTSTISPGSACAF
jgi:hypothetical protein